MSSTPRVTMLSIVGDWRIVIQSRDAVWSQKVVVFNAEAGTQTLNGQVGLSLDIHSNGRNPWQLRIQHNDGVHGWQDSWLRQGSKNVTRSSITQVIESEDGTDQSSDLDYNDLVIRMEKLGMVDQPTKPFAVWPTTMQMTPDGMFEKALGQYFMAVRVRNIWTETWPSDATVGLTRRCRQWLATAGIIIYDEWSSGDLATVNQQVVNGRIRVGALAPWETKVIYFKVDVSQARIRKHNIEVEVHEDLAHINRKATSQIFISETIYDAAQKAFVSTTDRGTMTVAIKELVVDYHSFKRAIGKARELFRREGTLKAESEGTRTGSRGGGGFGGGGSTSGNQPQRARSCNLADLEVLRRQLADFLAGKQVDICSIWQNLQYCCSRGGFGPGPSKGDWAGEGGTGMEFIAFPTVIDYRIDYNPSFSGQYGPIPYDDPWWKLALLIIAIVLTVAAAISAVADLAHRSDDVVIGQVTRSMLKDKDFLIDAAVVTLNGSRALRPSKFSFRDASGGEVNTTPLENLGGIIDSPGTTFSNDDIDGAIMRYMLNPNDEEAKKGVAVFKSGARTGVTFGRIARSTGPNPFTRGDGRTYIDQIEIEVDNDRPNNTNMGKKGDSGSLWLNVYSKAIVAHHWGHGTERNIAMASRIEYVKEQLKIRFAQEGM